MYTERNTLGCTFLDAVGVAAAESRNKNNNKKGLGFEGGMRK